MINLHNNLIGMQSPMLLVDAGFQGHDVIAFPWQMINRK